MPIFLMCSTSLKSCKKLVLIFINQGKEKYVTCVLSNIFLVRMFMLLAPHYLFSNLIKLTVFAFRE